MQIFQCISSHFLSVLGYEIKTDREESHLVGTFVLGSALRPSRCLGERRGPFWYPHMGPLGGSSQRQPLPTWDLWQLMLAMVRYARE